VRGPTGPLTLVCGCGFRPAARLFSTIPMLWGLVFQAIHHAASAGTACVIAGHDPITLEYVDHDIRMRDDRIVSEGSPGA
jgi:hypothetical protein